jgi:hypothetical protein
MSLRISQLNSKFAHPKWETNFKHIKQGETLSFK